MIKSALLVIALFLVSPAFAQEVITGLSLTVEGTDAVTVHNTGTSAFFGYVGDEGNYGYINGWGHDSGSILDDALLSDKSEDTHHSFDPPT